MLATSDTWCQILRNKFRMQRSSDYTGEGRAVMHTAMQREEQEIKVLEVHLVSTSQNEADVEKPFSNPVPSVRPSNRRAA